MARRNKSGTRDERAEELIEIFRFSYQQQESDITRLEKMQKTYDNVPEPTAWPTISQIPIASAWATTEEAVADAMDYLIPAQPFLDLIPQDKIEDDSLRRLEWAMYLMLVYRMRLKRDMYKSVKDSFKVSVGYGIVEPITIYPPAIFDIVAGNNRTSTIDAGAAVRELRFRYISPGRVIPYPQGTDFNGPDATPYTFLIDTYPEAQFRGMYDNQPKDGDAPKLIGNVEEIIEEARTRGFTSQVSIETFVNTMSGRRISKRAKDKRVPTEVPVMKVFEPISGKITWLSVGSDERVIYEDTRYSARRNPMVKLDPWMDADRWFPMSQPEADMQTVWAKNVWFNAIFDLMTWSIKRPMVWNNSEVTDAPDFGPDGNVGLPGKPDDMAKFLAPPGIDVGTFEFGNVLDGVRTQITGQRDVTEKNFTRGGSTAFTDMLNSIQGRNRMRYALLQMGGLERIADHTLSFMQELGTDMDLRFRKPSYREGTGERYYEPFELSEADLRHIVTIVIDLEGKHRASAMDEQTRIAKYQAKKDNPYWDQYEIQEDLEPDEMRLNKQRLPRETVEKKQAAREQAEMEGMRAGQQGAAPGLPGPAQGALGAVEGGVA